MAMEHDLSNCDCPICELAQIADSGCDCGGCDKDRERLEKEINEMSDNPYKDGDKVKIIKKQWNEEAGLPDPHGSYKVIATHGDNKIFLAFPRDCGVGGYCEDQSQVPDKYHGKYNGVWVSIEDVEKHDMKDKVISSGKEMGKAAGEGVKLALASQGAEFAYQQLSSLLQSRLQLTQQQMENPLVKETIKSLTPVIIHLACTVGDGYVPNADKVKAACELLIQDQSRQHAVSVITTFAPLIGEMASVMDPSALQQRVMSEATKPRATEAPTEEAVEEEVEELVELPATQATA